MNLRNLGSETALKNEAAAVRRCADEIASPPPHITINQALAGAAARGASPAPGTRMTDVIGREIVF